jgi:hypothetical protein
MLTKEVIQAYASIDRYGVIYGERGFAIGQIALGTELYILPRELSQLRLDVLEVQEDYWKRFNEHLNRMQYFSETENEGKWISLKEKENPFPWVRQVMGNPDPRDSYLNFLYQRGFRHPDFPDKDKYGISPWQSVSFVKSEDDKELSYHSASIPVSNGKGKLHFDFLRDCVLKWAKKLRPTHGLAGLTLLQDNPTQPGMYPTLQRYPGLDIQAALEFSGAAEGVYDRIKCVNWLTVLGDEIAEDLGGEFVLRNALEPECTLFPYPGGIMIQAGEAPRLGDVEQPEAAKLLEPYRKVAFITKRIRFMDYTSSLFRVDKPLVGADEARKWVSRFD